MKLKLTYVKLKLICLIPISYLYHRVRCSLTPIEIIPKRVSNNIVLYYDVNIRNLLVLHYSRTSVIIFVVIVLYFRLVTVFVVSPLVAGRGGPPGVVRVVLFIRRIVGRVSSGPPTAGGATSSLGLGGEKLLQMAKNRNYNRSW